MSTVTKPIALDETLQSTNTALSSLGKDTTLQAIATAIANVGLSNIGNMSSLATTDKTSLVSAINEIVGDVSDLDTDKADKVASATNGNLAGLNASGNLTDSGWDGAKTTTSASGNPISITGLKSNQLAVNPVITFEPIQAGSGDPSPSNVRAISGYDKIEVLSCGKNLINVVKANTAVDNDGEEYTNNTCCLSNGIYIKQGISYYVSWQNKSADLIAQKYKDSIYIGYVRLNNVRVFSFNDCNLVKLQWNGADATTGAVLPTNPQCEEGSSATTYSPYHKTTDLSEPLPQTVYGGSLDVRTGKLTVTHGIVDLGDLTYSYNASTVRYSTTVSGMYEYRENLDWICSCYKTSLNAYSDADRTNNVITLDNIGLLIRDNRYTSASDLKAALAGQKLVYKLATPIEIQLTPHEISLLKDYAYVSTNGTSIALDYHNGEIATLGDVAQLGETVNLIGEKVEFEDVSQYFTKDDTNINSANISAYRIGKMVFISGSFVPNALSSMQNKLLFNITNDKILPLSANIPVSGIYVPIISQSSTAWPIILSINKLNKRIKTDNNGAYGAITNITTNSLITFSASYVCQG